jgi:hypothetical protein
MNRNKTFRKAMLQFNQEAAALLPKFIHKMNVYVRTMGAKLVLLDLPHNSAWYNYHFPNSELKSSLKKYDQVLKNLSEDEGIPYFSFRDLADFKFDDFSDHTHLIQVGRNKFYPMYMKMLLPFFQELDIEKQL